MATKQTEGTDRILVYDVITTISDNDLRRELFKTCRGIKHVKRLYHTDEFQAPKELVQIEFISPKYAETILQERFIYIYNLRCQVKALKPTTRLQKQLQNGNRSDYQSETFLEEQPVTDKILVHDVPTTINENDLGKELSKIYRGIKHVKRWYYTNSSDNPTERVQIDFKSAEDTERILQDGFIEIGQLCCSVTPFKPSKHLQREIESDYGSDYQSEIFIEEQPITDQILVYNVPLTIDEIVLQKELSKSYPGIKQIIRWCFDDDCLFPMVCIQINFISTIYTKDILRDGFIINRNIFYKVKPLKSST